MTAMAQATMRYITLFTSNWGPKSKQRTWKWCCFWCNPFNNIFKNTLHSWMFEPAYKHRTLPPWVLSCCQIYFCKQETTGIVYHHRSESLIRSRLFLLEPVCFLISCWDAYMPWHDRALSSSASFFIRVLRQPQAQVAMHWGTPAKLSHISSVGKQRFVLCFGWCHSWS